jgi:structural maintenance of chromosome 3 (chondroitin sulfate proteoglycan 6)
LQAVRAVAKWQDEVETLRQRSLEIRREIERKDQEITSVMSGLQKSQQKSDQLENGFEPLKREIHIKSSHLEKKRLQLDSNIKQRETVETLLKEYGDKISGFEAELASDFKKALSANEERQLEQLGKAIKELQDQSSELANSRLELQSRKTVLEDELRANLRPTLDSLNSQAIDESASRGSGNLKESERELKRAKKLAAEVAAKLEENETQIEQAETKDSALEMEKAQYEQEQEETAKKIEKQQKKMESNISKKAAITKRAAEAAKNIRDLGVLPEEAFERFTNTDSKKVRPPSHTSYVY